MPEYAALKLPVGPGQVIDTVLGWQGFAAKARGIRAMLPHVDAFRAGHSIATLDERADAISRPGDTGETARLMAAMQG